MSGGKEQAVMEEQLPVQVSINISSIGNIVALLLKPAQQVVFVGSKIGEASILNLWAIKRDRKRTISRRIRCSSAIETAPAPGITGLVRQNAALEENRRAAGVIAHNELRVAHQSSRGHQLHHIDSTDPGGGNRQCDRIMPIAGADHAGCLVNHWGWLIDALAHLGGVDQMSSQILIPTHPV